MNTEPFASYNIKRILGEIHRSFDRLQQHDGIKGNDMALTALVNEWDNIKDAILGDDKQPWTEKTGRPHGTARSI